MFEYRVEKVAYTTPAKELQDCLNGHADEGWELAGIDPRPNGRATVYIFRREKKETDKPIKGFAGALTAGSS